VHGPLGHIASGLPPEAAASIVNHLNQLATHPARTDEPKAPEQTDARMTGGMPVCGECGGWGEHMSTCSIMAPEQTDGAGGEALARELERLAECEGGTRGGSERAAETMRSAAAMVRKCATGATK
jgi:hypothetical protein